LRKIQKVELKISYLSRILIISALVLISSCSNVGNNITINDTAEKVLPQESSEPTNNEDQNNIEEITDNKKGKEIITQANINQLVEVGNLEIDANGITWSPDGSNIAVGNFSRIIIYSSQNLKGLVQIDTNSSVKGLTFSPDGSMLASGGDSTISIWDPKNGRELMRIESKSEYVLSLAFSPDGEKIASGGSDGYIRIWDVKNGTELHGFEAEDRLIEDLIFSPDGNLLASGGQPQRGNARLWDLNNNDDYTFDESGTVFSILFTPDGKNSYFRMVGKSI